MASPFFAEPPKNFFHSFRHETFLLFSFCDANEVISKNYIPAGITVTSATYSEFLKTLSSQLSKLKGKDL